MSATYDETLPTAKDRARALLGDTVVTPASRALHSDEHMVAVLALEGSFELGVAFLADELVARFAQKPVKLASDGSSLDYSERVGAWRALAARMRTSATTAVATLTAGVIALDFQDGDEECDANL